MKLTIILILLFAGGCATSDSKMYDLLHREGANNLAYKSITIEDYKGEDYNISTSSVIFEDCNKGITSITGITTSSPVDEDYDMIAPVFKRITTLSQTKDYNNKHNTQPTDLRGLKHHRAHCGKRITTWGRGFGEDYNNSGKRQQQKERNIMLALSLGINNGYDLLAVILCVWIGKWFMEFMFNAVYNNDDNPWSL